MTKIIAHRGSKGTHPENTLAAFSEAVNAGAEGIELDIQLTKDKQLVVIHDETVDRTTNGHGEVRKMTLSELKELDAGSWFKANPLGQEIPTLFEVLRLLEKENYTGLLNLEIKTDKIHYEKIEQLVVKQMSEKVWDFKYMYSSFYFPSLEKIRAFDRSAELAYIFNKDFKEVQLAINELAVMGLHPQIDWLMKHSADQRLESKKIRPWTVNSTKQMRYCFEQALSGFHTDYPRKAKKIKESIRQKDKYL